MTAISRPATLSVEAGREDHGAQADSHKRGGGTNPIVRKRFRAGQGPDPVEVRRLGIAWESVVIVEPGVLVEGNAEG